LPHHEGHEAHEERPKLHIFYLCALRVLRGLISFSTPDYPELEMDRRLGEFLADNLP